MKTTSRIRIAGVVTLVITLLAVMSSVGLTFAEEASQAAVEDTSQATVQGTSQAIIHETAHAAPAATPQTVAQETPEVPVQIVPGAAKPFGGWQPTPIVAPMVAKIASIVNMKVEDLMAARHEGKSFMAIAAEKGISESQLVDALMEEQKTFLDAQVAQGRLTPEQVATAVSKIRENLKLALNRTEIGPPETKPNTGPDIGRKGLSRMQAAHGRAITRGRRVFMRGFSQGVQVGQRAGMRQGLGFGKDQSQGQGVCPFCGQTCPFCRQTQEPAN